MKFLSIGDQVRPGRYTVWTRFQNSVILFSTTRRALFIVAPALGDGPLNAVHPRPRESRLRHGPQLRRRPPLRLSLIHISTSPASSPAAFRASTCKKSS